MSREDDAPEPDRLDGTPHPRETGLPEGQGAAARAVLSAWAAGRLHHAWFLRGPQGVGKASFAYALARSLMAGQGPPETLAVPPDCPVARRIRAGSEPRLRVLRRSVDDKSKRLRQTIVIDDVRALKASFALSQPDGGRRVVIVDATDEMTVQAQNALLKLLEEPPEGTVLLLLAHAPAAVLPTIRSRCRRLDFAPLGPEDLATALERAGVTVPRAGADALAALSGGSVARAVRLVEADGLALYAELVGLLDGPRVPRPALLALADRLSAPGGRDRLFPMACDLTLVLLGRLSRAGVLGPPDVAAAPAEPAVMARAATGAAAARAWAEAAARFAAVSRQAAAVNLDPGQAFLDMWLDLDATLSRAA